MSSQVLMSIEYGDIARAKMCEHQFRVSVWMIHIDIFILQTFLFMNHNFCSNPSLELYHNEGGLMSAASGAASATAQSGIAENENFCVKYRDPR